MIHGDEESRHGMTARRSRILVVDDDPEIRALLRSILEGAGHLVETAGSGRTALETFAERRPDLLVIDLAMPEMDGWTVLERLQGQGRLPPVLILSERGEDPRRHRFRQCISACLFKPLRLGEVVGTCRRVLEMAARAEDFVQERRRDDRRPLVVEVTLPAGEGVPAVLGSLVDLSRGGFQLELGVPLEPGSPVRTLVSVPGSAPFSLEGQVRWRQSLIGGFLVGADLSKTDPEQARLLEALLTPPEPVTSGTV
jgi:CheY-like chemotaxis protein